MTKKFLSTREAAQLLNTSVGVLANLRHYGRGPPYIKLSKKILYDTSDIERWVQAHKVKTAD